MVIAAITLVAPCLNDHAYKRGVSGVRSPVVQVPGNGALWASALSREEDWPHHESLNASPGADTFGGLSHGRERCNDWLPTKPVRRPAVAPKGLSEISSAGFRSFDAEASLLVGYRFRLPQSPGKTDRIYLPFSELRRKFRSLSRGGGRGPGIQPSLTTH
jgi:hypothetical protein